MTAGKVACVATLAYAGTKSVAWLTKYASELEYGKEMMETLNPNREKMAYDNMMRARNGGESFVEAAKHLATVHDERRKHAKNISKAMKGFREDARRARK